MKDTWIEVIEKSCDDFLNCLPYIIILLAIVLIVGNIINYKDENTVGRTNNNIMPYSSVYDSSGRMGYITGDIVNVDGTDYYEIEWN